MKPRRLIFSRYFSTRSSSSSHRNLIHCMGRAFLLGWQSRGGRRKTSYRRHTSGSGDGRSLLLSTIVRQELLEIVQEIRCAFKESRDLRIDFLNRTLFALIRLQNFEEVLVNVGFISKASLNTKSATGTFSVGVRGATLILLT